MYLSIQYLRGISALAVVYFHLYQTTGQQGVAVFFVISGFIMIDIMNKKHRNFFSFFKARFLRVAPLYYLLILLTLLLGIAYDPTIQRIIQSFTFTALGSVLPVGWTLTFEFIFYTLVSISILIFQKMIYRLIFLFISLAIGDYLLNYILVSRNYEYGNYFWFFIFGMGSFYIIKNIQLIPQIFKNKYLLLFILMISTIYLFLGNYLGLSYYIDDVNHYLYNNLVASFLIVTSILILEIEQKWSFQNKILILLGNASYSIYLTHYIVIHAVHKYYNKEFNNELLLIGSIIVGVLTYLYLEKPLIKQTHKFIKESNASIK